MFVMKKKYHNTDFHKIVIGFVSDFQ